MNEVFRGRRVLGVGERFSDPPRRAQPSSAFDPYDAIVSSRLEHLAIQHRGPKDAPDDLLVKPEAVGDDQRHTVQIDVAREVAQQRQGVAVASSSGHRCRPEPRPDLDGHEDPGGLRLGTDEGAQFIRLELPDDESDRPASVESTAHARRLLQPASCGVPGNALNPSDRGNVDPLDPERHYSVEASSPMLEPVVRRTRGRGERPSARAAPISTAFARSRAVEAADDDILATDSSMGRTDGVGTSAIRHFRSSPCR